jgi:hypothetical protein
VLGEERVHDAEQQVCVGTGTDEEVLVGDLCRARAPRVHDDQLSAALLKPS